MCHLKMLKDVKNVNSFMGDEYIRFLLSKLCENERRHSILISKFEKKNTYHFLPYLIDLVYFRTGFSNGPQTHHPSYDFHYHPLLLIWN